MLKLRGLSGETVSTGGGDRLGENDKVVPRESDSSHRPNGVLLLFSLSGWQNASPSIEMERYSSRDSDPDQMMYLVRSEPSSMSLTRSLTRSISTDTTVPSSISEASKLMVCGSIYGKRKQKCVGHKALDQPTSLFRCFITSP